MNNFINKMLINFLLTLMQLLLTVVIKILKKKILNKKISRTLSLFSSFIWDVVELTKTGIGKTNNISEGWNNKFTTLVRINHSNIWLFIEALQMSNSSAFIKILNCRIRAFHNNLSNG